MEPTAWEGFGPPGIPPGGNQMQQEGSSALEARGAPTVHRNNHAASANNNPLVPMMMQSPPAHTEGAHNKSAGRGRSPVAPSHPHQQTPFYKGPQFATPDKLPPPHPPAAPFFDEGGKPRGHDPANAAAKNGKTPGPGEQGGPAYQDALMELARENLLLKHQLHVASMEVGRLKEVVENFNDAKGVPGEKKDFMKQLQSRYWSEDEHQRFLVAIQTYGHKDVKSIASVVGTRSATQVRTHAQKYFMKLARSSTMSGTAAKNGGSNPDQDPSEGAEEQEQSIKSMEAAAAAAAAAGEAGTSAAAAAAFVAATNNKQQAQQSASKGRSAKQQVHSPGRNLGVKPAVHKPAATASLQSELKTAQGNLKPGLEHKKRDKNLNGRAGSGKGPGSPGSMGSSGSVGCSDSTSASHGNASNGIRSSDTTTGNGSSGSSGSNSRHRPRNGNRSSCDSNNGVSSTEGSDHGFFDTGAEEEENFPEELQENAGTESLCGLGPL